MPLRLLVPTDLSEGADRALAYAAEIARRRGGAVHLLHTIEALTPEVSQSFASLPVGEWLAEAERVAARELALRAEGLGRLAVTTEVRSDGVASDAIVDAARKGGYDLVVMGTHGRRGLRRFVLGSVAEEVIRHAPCPVLTVPLAPEVAPSGPVRKALVPVDFSEEAVSLVRRAADWVRVLGPRNGGPAGGGEAGADEPDLHLLHVVEPVPYPALWGDTATFDLLMPDLRASLSEPLHALAAAAGDGLAVHARLEPGPVAQTIVDLAVAEAVDLLVIATHGRAGLSRLILGSVTERVARTAPCPVLTLRAGALDADVPGETTQGETAQGETAQGEHYPREMGSAAGTEPPHPRAATDAGFPQDGPPEAQLRYLVHTAVLAPSVLNTQPWRFALTRAGGGGPQLELWADRARQLPRLDPTGRELLLSCGAALLHLRLAARHFGFEPVVATFPDAARPDLLATVRLGPARPATAEENRLYRAVRTRRTNRGAFTAQPIPAGVLDELAEAARAEGARLAVLTEDREKEALADLVAEGTRHQGLDRALTDEMGAWLRPAGDPRPDGVPDRAQGDWDRRAAARIAPDLLARRRAALVADAPAALVLATDDDAPGSWLAAGCALGRVLLAAASHDLYASYLNAPVEVDGLRERVADLVGHAAPHVVLRVGYPEVQPGTPRRSARDVLEA